MEAKAVAKYIRISPRKARQVVDPVSYTHLSQISVCQ